MVSRAAIVAEARSWARTPFHHQGNTRAGCDCVGLVRGVAAAVGVQHPALCPEAFAALFGGYSRVPSGNSLRDALDSALQPIDPQQAADGDVLLMTFMASPHHVGFRATHPYGGPSIIHAYQTVGMVTEHALDAKWQRRLVGAYRLPGVDA